MVFRNVYVPNGVDLSPATKGYAAWLWSGRRATLAGLSAAAWHGARWIDADAPAELNRPGRNRVDGMLFHSDVLHPDEVCVVRGVPVTTPARTAFDLGRRSGLTLAVMRIDALLRATGTTVAEVLPVVDRHKGARGIVALREALALADPGAESPQETRTRLVLLRGGLPTPATQVEVFDDGRFVARVDLGYDEWKVAIEFDGAQHWLDPVQRTRDIDRIADLEAAQWRVIRVSAELLRLRPHVVIARVEAALRAAGWRGERRMNVA